MNKKFIYRIKNKDGYSIATVLLSLMIVSTLAIFISTQVSRQIISTTKRTNEIQLQYTSEAGIDRTIEEILIEINGLKTVKSYAKERKKKDVNYIELIKEQINNLSQINDVDTSNLNRAINSIDYDDTIEEIILELNYVRTELLNIVKNNPSKRIQIKDVIDINIEKVCRAIDYANLEKNKNILPIEFNGGTTPDGFQEYQIKLNDIIGNNKDKYGNTYKDIVIYMASAWSKIDSIHAAGQNNNMNSHLEETKNLVSLAQNMHSMANNVLHNKLLQYSSKFNVYNPDKQLQEKILKEAKESLKEIENIIDEYISYIRNIRKEIYSSYTYCMANYTLGAEDDFMQYTDEALEMYDIIEDQLIWFKKKIGVFSSNNNGNDESDSDIPDNDNTIEINPKDIVLNGYTGKFNVMNLDYTYVVKYETEGGVLVDEITLPIKSQNLKIINLTLVSIATNGSNSYKTRASIEFNIDGAIKYTVNSYKRIN